MQSNVFGKKTVKEWIFTTNCRITDAAELKFSPIEVFSKGIEVGNFAYENNLFPEHLLVYVFFLLYDIMHTKHMFCTFSFGM